MSTSPSPRSKSVPMATGFENAQEQLTPIELNIRGEFPPWLSGVLYRTGPGTYSIPSSSDPSKVTEIQHWFDGLTMHHRFEILPGSDAQTPRVLYRSHRGAAERERLIADVGEYPSKLFSFAQRQRDTDPCANLFQKFFTSFTSLGDAVTAISGRRNASNSTANVGVTMTPNMPGLGVKIKGADDKDGPDVIVAKTDANVLQVLDASTLDPLKVITYTSFDPRLSGQLSAAHACRDSKTGDFYNFVAEIALNTTYKVFKIRGDDGKVEVLAEICEKDAPPSYIHAVTMTDRFFVICIWQAHIKLHGFSLLFTHNIADAIEQTFYPEKPVAFYVVDRHRGGVVAKYKADPFFAFHYLNAYDDPASGDVIIDLSVLPDASIVNMLHLDKLRDTQIVAEPWCGQARRFRLSDPAKVPGAGEGTVPELQAQVDFTLPKSASIELPTLAPGKHHRPYQFAYGVTKKYPVTEPGQVLADGIVKFDMHAAAATATAGSGEMEQSEEHYESYARVWRAPGLTPSEPIFAARPGGTTEDDGVLLSVVLDSERDAGKSALVVIDAQTMKEVARAEMPIVYPFGFHGVYLPEGMEARKNPL